MTIPRDPQVVEAPTLDEIEQALKSFNTAVDAEDVLAGTVYAAVCTSVLERLRDCLRSGEYALISREDRALALAKMLTSGVADATGYADVAAERHAEAHRLLKLEIP